MGTYKFLKNNFIFNYYYRLNSSVSTNWSYSTFRYLVKYIVNEATDASSAGSPVTFQKEGHHLFDSVSSFLILFCDLF